MMNKVDHIKLLQESFEPFLYQSNPRVVASLKRLGMDEDTIRRTELFDWFQGVGLYGYYQAYKKTGDRHILDKIIKYYDSRIKDGLPAKNINSMAPLLTMVMMLDEGLVPGNQYDSWHQVVVEWSKWLMNDHPRTKEGGFSHLTCEADNSQELWDDTLFMAVLFLAKAGMYLGKKAYVEEAVYQFLIHQEYLLDRQSGLWFHGWTFDGNHNFAEAKWNRGNSWITLFVPLFLDIVKDYDLAASARRLMIETYNRQVKAILEILN